MEGRRRAGRRRLQRPGSSDRGGLSGKEDLNFHHILKEELIELADGLEWGKGERLELVCLNLGPVLF